ncbi:MAG: condensation domain-containing protein, partial [Sheuella sp.]|nr:condensation domain-containing protein [Sheuella sp.]
MTDQAHEVLYPLTGAQRNVWFHQKIDLTATPYNAGQHILIEGKLDIQRLDFIQQKLIEDTEILGIRFVELDHEPYQAFFAVSPSALSQWDLRKDLNPELASEKLLSAQQHLHFDLEKGPLFRFGLIRIEDERWIWFWFYHHIIMDGAGVASMLTRLVESYRSNTLVPSEVALSWSQAVQEDNNYRQSPQWKDDSEYWRQTLDGILTPASLTSHPPTIGDLQTCETTSIELERIDFDRIASWGKQHNLSLYPCFAAAVAAYLSRMTGEKDLCLGCPTDGRNRKTRATPGMLTNILSLRIQISSDENLLAIARQFSIQLKQALRHRQYPLGEIVKQRLTQNLSEPFSVLVNLESFDHHADFGTAQGTLYTRASEPVADLQLFIFDRRDNGSVELRLAYNSRRYSAKQANTHLIKISQLIQLLASSGEQSIATLSILDHAQRATVLKDSCGPLVDLSVQPQSLPALFAAQVAASPDNPALIFELSADSSSSMRYDE